MHRNSIFDVDALTTETESAHIKHIKQIINLRLERPPEKVYLYSGNEYLSITALFSFSSL
jgi:hypothetical protein